MRLAADIRLHIRLQKPFEDLLGRRVFGGPIRDRVPHICESTGLNVIVFGYRRKHVVLGKRRGSNLF